MKSLFLFSFLLGFVKSKRDGRVASLENEFRPGFWHRPIIVQPRRVDSTCAIRIWCKMPLFLVELG